MFGWFRKKVKQDELHSNLSSAFDRIKSDLSAQRKVIDELHSNHHELKKTTHSNHQRIADWISHFDSSIKRLENDLVKLESRVARDLHLASEASAKHIQDGFEQHREELSALKDSLRQEVSVFLEENRLKTPIINVNNADNVNNVMDSSFDALSNPEKWLVGVLFNAESPLSYAQIAERTGKTISTVRVYMNQLKIKGFIEESALPNGVKIFGLQHKAKVKKLYNL